jgi:hypothetical protein
MSEVLADSDGIIAALTIDQRMPCALCSPVLNADPECVASETLIQF